MSHVWIDCIDNLVQDCSNSIANALELLLSGIKSAVYTVDHHVQYSMLWKKGVNSLRPSDTYIRQ